MRAHVSGVGFGVMKWIFSSNFSSKSRFMKSQHGETCSCLRETVGFAANFRGQSSDGWMNRPIDVM